MCDYVLSVLQPTDERKEYKKLTNLEMALLDTVHLGQMKLQLSEIGLLLSWDKNGDPVHTLSKNIVYAGAADGNHIWYLAQMFPEHHFYLYDPRPMYGPLADLENVHIYGPIKGRKNTENPKHEGYFLDEDAKGFWKKFKGDMIFLSDIRVGEETVKITDESVMEDMYAQENWCKIMKPRVSLLKFRLPWSEGKTTYMEGDILYQPFAHQTATETRLVVWDTSKNTDYDNIDYEQKLFYWNTYYRRVCDYDLGSMEELHEIYRNNTSYVSEERKNELFDGVFKDLVLEPLKRHGIEIHRHQIPQFVITNTNAFMSYMIGRRKDDGSIKFRRNADGTFTPISAQGEERVGPSERGTSRGRGRGRGTRGRGRA